MTWQCPRCMVTFRGDCPQYKSDRPAVCEADDCHVKYFAKLQNHKSGENILVAMYLVDNGHSPALEEYRRRYEREFEHET